MCVYLQWMETMWQSDPCYGQFGVDGSQCSFIMYLSEVGCSCPSDCGKFLFLVIGFIDFT